MSKKPEGVVTPSGIYIELLLTLPPEAFTSLLLQLSREELLSRFGEQN